MDNPLRRRFLAWFERTYGETDTSEKKEEARRKFMGKTGYTKGRVTQLFDPDEPLENKAARNIAERIGKPADYFLVDRPEFGHSPERERALVEGRVLDDLRDIERIDPEAYKKLLSNLRIVADGVRASEQMDQAPQAEPKKTRPPPKINRDQAPARHQSLLGDASGFGARTGDPSGEANS